MGIYKCTISELAAISIVNIEGGKLLILKMQHYSKCRIFADPVTIKQWISQNNMQPHTHKQVILQILLLIQSKDDSCVIIIMCIWNLGKFIMLFQVNKANKHACQFIPMTVVVYQTKR